ncbi:MAG TPA: hypothetical protein VGF22_14260, partial [Acidimicrobiales bacterium]
MIPVDREVEPENAPAGAPRFKFPARRWAPLAAVIAVVAFNLWSLRAELPAVHDLNDGSFQQAYV